MKKIKFIILLLTALFSFNAFSDTAKTTKTLLFATEATYPPFEYIDVFGKIQGFDIDIAQALCKQMNVQCTFSNQPFDSLIPSLKIGKFDALIGAIAITNERKKQVDFSDSYYQPTGIFVAAISEHLALNPQSLKGKTIGIQSGTTFEQYLQATYGNTIKINTYNSMQDAFLDLSAGRIDAALGDTATVTDWIKKHGQNKYSVVGQPINDPKYLGDGFGIAVQKGNTTLLNALNKALATIKSNGTYDKIYTKYFGK